MSTDTSGLELLEPVDMARKKAEESKPEFKQVILISYKADERTAPEVRKWLDELAADIGAPVSVTIDIALNALAKSRKFRTMPKRLVR